MILELDILELHEKNEFVNEMRKSNLKMSSNRGIFNCIGKLHAKF